MENEGKSYFVSWEWIDKHGNVMAIGDAIVDTEDTLTSNKRDDLVSEITKGTKGDIVNVCTMQIKTINLL